MAYFVTGGTGFIGRRVIARLAARGEPVYLLVRAGSQSKVEALARSCAVPGARIIPVPGDLNEPGLGVSAADRSALQGRIRHFLHLGALYDLNAAAGDLERANVQGTSHALELAHAAGAERFHLVSSIASAGLYPGVFREDMFEQAGPLVHPYLRSKHESEALVRRSCRMPWRIYRPGMVVGDSESGVMDKVDGPYYLFGLIQALRHMVPEWVPLPGFDGGYCNLVPVDFVAQALVHLVHEPDQDGRCFHLTDPQNLRLGEVLDAFAQAAHAPRLRLQAPQGLAAALAGAVAAARAAEEPLRRILARQLADLGIPESALVLLGYPTRFDCREAQALLGPAGIQVPPLRSYAWRLWDYWERQLEPARRGLHSLPARVRGRVVLITGGSSGIGRATAVRLAPTGARLVLLARDRARLESVREEVAARGGCVDIHACDITDAAQVEQAMQAILASHGNVDVLINNAGHSIRRAIDRSYDRLHDYERLMRINYLAAVRMTLAVLPGMVSRGDGHVISISSIGVLSNAARFGAYNASKAALEAFTRCAAGEYRDRGVRFTVINMPLVRTAMVAPTRIYEQLPLISPEAAAEMVCEALVRRPERLATRLGALAQVVELLLPRLNRAVMAETYTLFPESAAAGGSAEAERLDPQSVALGTLLHGGHW